MSMIDHIKEYGWATSDFAMSLEKRAEFTALGNQIIDLAAGDERLQQALTYKIADRPDPRGQQANLFGIHPAQHSPDDKLWFHVGYQTREHLNAVIPEDEQPQLLKDFMNALDDLLDAVDKGFRKALTGIDAEELIDDLLPEDHNRRAIHVRVVRYLNARAEDAAAEPVSGHADMSVCTLHLYETHGNWFHAAAMDQNLLVDEQNDDRRAKVKTMRNNLSLIKEIDEDKEAVFFLGGGWKQLPHHSPSKDYEKLPVCYHAGIRPSKQDEYISSYADKVLTAANDRVSLVVFTQPSLDYIASHEFQYPTVDQIRPQY